MIPLARELMRIGVFSEINLAMAVILATLNAASAYLGYLTMRLGLGKLTQASAVEAIAERSSRSACAGAHASARADAREDPQGAGSKGMLSWQRSLRDCLDGLPPGLDFWAYTTSLSTESKQ